MCHVDGIKYCAHCGMRTSAAGAKSERHLHGADEAHDGPLVTARSRTSRDNLYPYKLVRTGTAGDELRRELCSVTLCHH